MPGTHVVFTTSGLESSLLEIKVPWVFHQQLVHFLVLSHMFGYLEQKLLGRSRKSLVFLKSNFRRSRDHSHARDNLECRYLITMLGNVRLSEVYPGYCFSILRLIPRTTFTLSAKETVKIVLLQRSFRPNRRETACQRLIATLSATGRGREPASTYPGPFKSTLNCRHFKKP
jgi:hypothetical protein